MAVLNSMRGFSKRKMKRQKQYRRRTSLMKKAYEYSKMCDADVCVAPKLITDRDLEEARDDANITIGQ
ncbi:hypothetical protein NUU61_004566 [Penicillium alfredii]|uniref:MADS-box domain-containing protein n=1 Tax=Penicillium alfredii TaxID=1506179 RepID=A0A9W9KDH1_9EURO|nr:uncharacterized protein NUU61_004566 [Penicillium alfredii]KAJ5102344.1 hypothetical protein NUU61_004566 [Penicillium alfredii]